jgi:hypothetical protein
VRRHFTFNVKVVSGPSLVKLVAVVWSAAILVAVFIGLPALLVAGGVEINAGLVITALSAVGTFTAAGVALWVATNDRRTRMRDRDAEDEAQAKLVVVSAIRVNPGLSAQLQIIVRNLSPRAIVDATFVELTVAGHEQLHLSPTTDQILPVITSGGDGNFMFEPQADETDPLHRAVRGRWEIGPGGGGTCVDPPTIEDRRRLSAPRDR